MMGRAAAAAFTGVIRGKIHVYRLEKPRERAVAPTGIPKNASACATLAPSRGPANAQTISTISPATASQTAAASSR